MQRSADVEYFVERSIRRGVATCRRLDQVSAPYGPDFADALARELNTAGVRLIGAPEAVITPRTNVLLNDLRLTELVSLALRLPVAPKMPRRLYTSVVSQRSYELNLKRLEYLDSDTEWYYLSPSFNRLQLALRRLLDSGQIPFGKEWRSRRTNLAYLKRTITHSSFSEAVLPIIRKHYLTLTSVQLLSRWIRGTGKQGPAMVDIIDVGLDTDGPELVQRTLLSEQPSTGGSALASRRDICFSCPPERRCLPLQGLNDPYDILVQYRSSDLATISTSRDPNSSVGECLLRDKLIVKFFAPYGLVVSTKRFMIETGCLDRSARVLYKNLGRYCPYDDEWPLVH